jgi:hypothetical protein
MNGYVGLSLSKKSKRGITGLRGHAMRLSKGSAALAVGLVVLIDNLKTHCQLIEEGRFIQCGDLQ